jgi:hypothetical protein
MKKIPFFLLILLTCNLSFSQAYSKSEVESRCINLGNERASSLNARDYKGMRNVIKWGIDNCKPYLNRDSYYEQFGDLALAERENGNFQSAMKSVDECIKNRYGLPHCHIEKFIIFKEMGNTKEAVQGAKTFKLIAIDAIDKKKKSMLNPYLKNYEKELIESEISAYESMLGFAEQFLEGK